MYLLEAIRDRMCCLQLFIDGCRCSELAVVNQRDSKVRACARVLTERQSDERQENNKKQSCVPL